MASSDQAQCEICDQMQSLQTHFNAPTIAVTASVLSVVYNIIVASLILNQGFSGWMSGGSILGNFSRNGGGFSFVGPTGLLLQTMLIYWVLIIFWRGALFSFGVKKVFRRADSLFGLRYFAGNLTCVFVFFAGD